MKIRNGLSCLVRGLTVDRSERRRLVAAAVALLRQRRISLIAFGPILRVMPSFARAKLLMWQLLARSCSNGHFQGPVDQTSFVIADELRFTQAYANAAAELSSDRNGFLQRGLNYADLRQRWREQPPERLLVFHHYDRRGFLPQSWSEALLALQEAGWQVLLSSTQLDHAMSASLEAAGVQIVFRENIGLCLGAYRDLALLFQFTPELQQHLQALVLCNDSNLLVQPPDALVAQLERWTSHNPAPRPVLAGLTDSVERDLYHLQSFLLHANRALLQHPAWLRFWLNFAIDGSKDDLINQGEIGLSQALLTAGVKLKPAYPLIEGLLMDPSMAEELQMYGIAQPEHVNQSLFAWRSLLARGFPLVKKHVLFQLVEHQGQPMAIAELAVCFPQNAPPCLPPTLSSY